MGYYQDIESGMRIDDGSMSWKKPNPAPVPTPAPVNTTGKNILTPQIFEPGMVEEQDPITGRYEMVDKRDPFAGKKVTIDENGWRRVEGTGLAQHTITGNVVPADTFTTPSTEGTPYETDRGGGFGGFLGVGDWVGKNITMPAGEKLGQHMDIIVPVLGAAVTAGAAGAAMGAGGVAAGAGGAGAAGAGSSGVFAAGAAAGAAAQGGVLYGTGTAAAAAYAAAAVAAMEAGAASAEVTAAAVAAGDAAATGAAGGAAAGTVPESVLSVPGVGSAGQATPALIGQTVTPGMTAAATYLGLTVPEWLGASSLALTAAGTIAAIAGGGDKTTSATTTMTPTGPGTYPAPGGATNPDGTVKTAAKDIWDKYVDDYFKIDPESTTPSVKDRIYQDQAALTGYQKALLDKLGGLDTTRLAETKAAVAPYQNQLTDIQGQLSGNKGLGERVAFGYGGKQMPSFVPKTNRALADQLLGMGRESSSINTGLADMGYQQGTNLAGRQFGFESENLPNKAADTYSAKLEALMKYLNPNTGQTSTTTGTVPGVPWYTTALQGLNTGVNLWDKIYNPRAAAGGTLRQNADGTFSVVGG